MNTRASGRYSELKSYATIGWGTRAEAMEDTAIFEELDEEALNIFKRRVGQVLPQRGIANIEINKLYQQNLKGEYKAFPGILGELLGHAGLKTAAIGNSDTDSNKSRAIGFLAMDSKGYIEKGNVGEELLLEDDSSPFGIRTDYESLLSEFEKCYGGTALIAVETGDLSRLEAYKANLNSSTYNSHKLQILNNIDDFVGRLVEIIDFNTSKLIIVSPFPSDASYEAGDRLTPIIFYEGKEAGRGILTSDTTRRRGIVGNVDIAPTILENFNIAAKNTTGRRITSIPMEDNLNYIQELNKKTVNTSVIRYRILYSFAVYQMLVAVLALLVIVYRKRLPKGIVGISGALLLSTIVTPLVFLVLSIFGVGSMLRTYIIIIILSAGLTIVLYSIFKRDPLKVLAYTSALIVISLLVDIALGQNLIKSSILGYDPIIGARYYGIGNEFVGVLLGSSLIAATALQEKLKKRPLWLMSLFSIIILFIGFPKLGANVGGTITAMFAFLFTYSLLTAKKMSFKRWSIILAIVVGAIIALALVDFFLLESKSHLAGAIQQIAAGGPVIIYQIIIRKITMNIRVMSVTIWSRVLLLALGILGVLFYRPTGLLKKLSSRYPSLLAGWSGIIVACIVGFAVNDSGVVLAATCIIFLTTSILYLLLMEEALI